MMYKNRFIVSLLLVAGLLFSCETNKVEPYDGPSQLHFLNETGRIILIEDNLSYYLQLGVTRPENHDRTFSLVVNEEKTDAVEGVHYTLPESDFVIKAGEVLVQVPVNGLPENADSAGVALNITLKAKKDNEVANFRNDFDLEIYRYCDFNLDELIGTFKVFEQSISGYYEYEVKTKKGDDPFSIKVTGLYERSEELTIRFDPISLDCYIQNQLFFYDNDYGVDVWIRTSSMGQYTSCIGSIFDLEFTNLIDNDPEKVYDKGTFSWVRIED